MKPLTPSIAIKPWLESRPEPKPRRNQPEQELQRNIFRHLRERGARDMVAFHVPNGGARTRAEAAIFKGLGVLAGVPDIIIIIKGRVLGIELKSPTGRLSPAQLGMWEQFRAAGATYYSCSYLDEALEWLEARGVLRGKAVLRTIGDVAERVGNRAVKAAP